MARKNPIVENNATTFSLGQSERKIAEYFIKRVPSSIAVFDRNLCFVALSERFIDEFKLNTAHDYVGQHWYDVVPDMPRKWQTIHAKSLQGAHIKCKEDNFTNKDGYLQWWSWESFPWYDEDGEVGGITIAIENITRHKKTEKNLKQTFKSLNESNRALARFAHICAHDLNEPIRAIANYCQLIYRFHNIDQDETLKKHLVTIADNACIMSGLVKTLSDYSQLRIRRIKPEHTDFNDVIKEIINFYQEKIQSKQILLAVDDMPKIHVDPKLMYMVINNIVDNAYKFNKNLLKEVYIKIKDCQHFWLFSIHDNGIGIDSKYLNKIFIEFMRLHPKSEYNGAGMGLAQAKKIIEDHNGRIWAESTLNQGSIFYFTIMKGMVNSPQE